VSKNMPMNFTGKIREGVRLVWVRPIVAAFGFGSFVRL
jgi:hypothetical protein